MSGQATLWRQGTVVETRIRNSSMHYRVHRCYKQADEFPDIRHDLTRIGKLMVV